MCCSSHWQIALSLFFSVYHSVLADKLADINYSEKSLEWAETDTDSDSDCELWLISRCRRLVVERLCFNYIFLCFKNMFFFCFYSQVNAFNIYGNNSATQEEEHWVH